MRSTGDSHRDLLLVARPCAEGENSTENRRVADASLYDASSVLPTSATRMRLIHGFLGQVPHDVKAQPTSLIVAESLRGPRRSSQGRERRDKEALSESFRSRRLLEHVSSPSRDLWHLPRWAWWVTMECWPLLNGLEAP